MLIKLPSGNKPDNDKLLLDQGFIVLDNESKGIRVHDGSTVGGFESIGVETPHPSKFLGEVAQKDLITPKDLNALVGLGGAFYNTSDAWLKFYDEVDGKTKYFPKQPFKISVSWNQLNNVGVVYGKEIVIKEHRYICRLIKASLNETSSAAYDAVDDPDTWGSEWNRLMYPICAPTGNAILDKVSPSGPQLGTWAQYNQQHIFFQYWTGTGNVTWCQETAANNPTEAVTFGAGGVALIRLDAKSINSNDRGWRPLLELIE